MAINLPVIPSECNENTQPSFRTSVTSVGISFKAVWDCHVGHNPPRNDVYNEIATSLRPRNDVDYEIATSLPTLAMTN